MSSIEPTFANWPYPRWIAHRGAGKFAPENTLAAFREGARRGYRAFECDVKLSADGVPFLLHDTTLDRTTSGTGSADALSLGELVSLDAGAWHSPTFAGEPLPSLERIAQFILANGYSLNIEIKPVPGTDEMTGRVVASVAQRLWTFNPVLPLMSSFRVDALEGARTGAPALPRALLLDAWKDDTLDNARELGCVAVVVAFHLLDAEKIREVHTRSLRCLTYTVNEVSISNSLIARGIDGLITDRLDLFSPTLGD